MAKIILLNKPYNVVCQFSREKEEELTLADYISEPGFYPAGRLDKKSEGLVLLTDNGPLQQRLSNPRFAKNKYYWVQVEGIPTNTDLEPLRKGLKTNKYSFLPAKARLINSPALWERNPPIRYRQTIPTSWLEIILNEGKNHQIRHMTGAIGFPTLRLIRYQIDQWSLDALKPGEFKVVSL